MTKYGSDREFTERFVPQIQCILGPMLLAPTTFEQDTKHASDFVTLAVRELKIACRIRRPEYYPKYRNDFTIRSKRDSGAVTELAKIQRGFADWMFYGHTDDGGLCHYFILNLHRFRKHLNEKSGVTSNERSNGDGTHFIAYDVTSFHNPSIVICRWFRDSSLQCVSQQQADMFGRL